MYKYTKEQIEKLYDNDPNIIGQIFLRAGYTDDYITNMFNVSSKEKIVLRATNIIRKLDESDEFYQIPECYKKAEIKELQEDRDDMYNEVNNIINKNTGKILQSLYDYEKDKYIIGIHRTASPPESIFSSGIKYSKYPDLYDHVQIFENFPFMLREIMYCEDYKLSRGSYIIKIPKSAIKGNINEAEPIYYKNKDGNIYLRPEFIAAYVPVNNRKLGDVELNKLNHDDIYQGAIEFYQDDNVSTNQRSYGFINIIIISLIAIIVCIIIFLILK